MISLRVLEGLLDKICNEFSVWASVLSPFRGYLVVFLFIDIGWL